MANPEIALKVMVSVQNSKALDNVKKQIDGTSKAAENAQGASRGFLGAVNDAQKGLDGVFRAGFRMQILGGQIMSAGQSMLAPITDSLKQFGDFEFMVNRAAGALNFFNGKAKDGSATTIDLQDAINKASIQLKLFPATDVAQGLYFWASATGETITKQNDIQKLMARFIPVMKASALTQTDYELATKGVLGVMQQFGMTFDGTEQGIKNVSDVTNLLYGYTKATALEFPNVIEAFKYAGTAAHNLKIPFDDVAAALGALGNLGLRGGIAGRGLAQVFNKLANPSKQARTEMDKLFKSVYGGTKTFSKMIFPAGKFVGLRNSVKILAYAMKGLNDEEKQRLINQLFTQNAARTMMPLLNKQMELFAGGKKDVKDYASAIDVLGGVSTDATKSLDKDFSMLSDSWKGVTEGLNRAWEAVKNTVGRVAAEYLTPIVKKVEEWVVALNEIIKKNPQLVRFAAALGIITVAIGGLLTVIGTLLGIVAGLTFVMNLLLAPEVIAAALAFAAALAVVGIAIGIVASVMMDTGKKAGSTLSVALMDVVTFIGNILTEITNAIPAITNALLEWGSAFVIWIIQAMPQMGTTLAGAFQYLLAKVAEFLSALVPALAQLGNALFRWILEAIPPMLLAIGNFLSSMLSWLGDHAGDIVNKLMEWALAFVGWLVDAIPMLLANLVRFLAMIIIWVFNNIPTIQKVVLNFIDAFISWVPKAIPFLLDALGKLVGNLMKWFLTDGIQTFIDIGAAIVRGLWNGITGLIGWLIDKVAQFIKDVIPGPIKDFLGIKSPSKLMAGIGENIVQGLANGITNTDSALIAMQDYSMALAQAAASTTANIGLGTNGGYSVVSDNTRTISLKVEVTSPDGAVDALTASQIAGAIESGALVRSLEQMAAVG
jgi:TP901 family phage tail tape measure protein